MRERVLIVGGTGFIGKSLTHLCMEFGFSCFVLSKNHQINDRIEGINYLQADVSDKNQIIDVLNGKSFEYVVNLSGYIDHTHYFSGGRTLIDVHFSGLLNLLDNIDRSVLKRFVQIGSSDEYGNLPAPQNEKMREAPISPYSVAKTASTQLLQMLYRTERFPVTILRLFLVYGEGQEDKRFIPQVIRGCLDDREFNVSLGRQLRDFCYVSDIASGIIDAMRSGAADGEVVNLGSGNPISIREVIEKIQHLTGRGKPRFGEIPYRAGENMELWADTSKAKILLNWQPRVSIDDGLMRTLEGYLV